jgi:flagellar hook assembly protein FlgD
MSRFLLVVTLLILLGSLHAFIGEAESNVFSITGTPVDDTTTPSIQHSTSMRTLGPNPFRSGSQTRIELNVKADETAVCGIYNIAGQLITSQSYRPGSHQLEWDGRDLHGNPCGSGIYLIKLKSPSHSSSAKLILIK